MGLLLCKGTGCGGMVLCGTALMEAWTQEQSKQGPGLEFFFFSHESFFWNVSAEGTHLSLLAAAGLCSDTTSGVLRAVGFIQVECGELEDFLQCCSPFISPNWVTFRCNLHLSIHSAKMRRSSGHRTDLSVVQLHILANEPGSAISQKYKYINQRIFSHQPKSTKWVGRNTERWATSGPENKQFSCGGLSALLVLTEDGNASRLPLRDTHVYL